jgi:hypothetical protein
MATKTSKPPRQVKNTDPVKLFFCTYRYLCASTDRSGKYNGFGWCPFDASVHFDIQQLAYTLAESDRKQKSQDRYWEMAKAYVAAKVAGDFSLNVKGGRLTDLVDRGFLEALADFSLTTCLYEPPLSDLMPQWKIDYIKDKVIEKLNERPHGGF